MQTQEILRKARESQGLTLADVASEIGTTPEHVRDLEDHGDELSLTLSVGQCLKLLKRLHVSFEQFTGQHVDDSKNKLTLSGFIEALRCLEADEKAHGRNLADDIGYEIGAVFSNANAVYEWNLDCLKEVCARLSLDWASVLALLARKN